MRNLWLVAKHEYLKIVKQKSFIVGTLGMPLLIVVVTAISIIVAVGQRGNLPLGYVDQAGVLSAVPAPVLGDDGDLVELRAFNNEAAARAALENKELQGYYRVPVDYTTTGRVELFYIHKRPSEIARFDFVDFLQLNLIADLPPAIQTRLLEGSTLTVHSADGEREFDTENPFDFILPYIIAMLFFFAILSSGGYMLQAITDEKENRTIEILATSLRPIELIGGKSLGLMSVGLTQLGIWAGTAILALVAVTWFLIELPPITFPGSFLFLIGLFFIPTYALLVGMMTAVGIAVTDLQQGQQITGILNMLFTFPVFLVILIMEKPDHLIVTVLTLFPTTSFLTITTRWAVTTVPLWQLVLSWLILVGAAIFCVWVAARIFRLGMLSYGQRLNLKNILSALRPTHNLNQEAANANYTHRH